MSLDHHIRTVHLHGDLTTWPRQERWRVVDTEKVVGVKFLFRRRDVTLTERDVYKASRAFTAQPSSNTDNGTAFKSFRLRDVIEECQERATKQKYQL